MREVDGRVVDTLVTQHPKGAYGSPRWIADNLRYPNFEPIHCIEGTWGWELHDDVATSSDILLRKYRRSAFVGTNLVDLLHTQRAETLIVSGVAAAGCSTVRDAIEHDFFVVVPVDCIGDGTPELVQAACATFARLLLPGDLTDSSQLADALAKVGPDALRRAR